MKMADNKNTNRNTDIMTSTEYTIVTLLLARGMTTREAAERLVVSPSTVYFHCLKLKELGVELG